MLVKHFFNSKTHTISFSIHLTDEEVPVYNNARSSSTLSKGHFRILLPDKIDGFECLHPDQWALIILLVVFPFVKTELRLSFAVSSAFAVAYRHSGKDIYPVNPSLDSFMRSEHPRLRPSVAFTGRVHSFTTAAILGPSSYLVALNHWDSLVGERTSPYPEDALFYSLDHMEEKGYNVQVVKTDIQSVFEPYGFVHPLTSAIGSILLSNILGIDSVHFGCHMDELNTFGKCVVQKKSQKSKTPIYRLDTNQKQPMQLICFKNYQLHIGATNIISTEQTLSFWRTLFEVVQLCIDFPLCGVTDTMLVKLLYEHQLWSNVHYCLYSRPKRKCGMCIECFYYDSLYRSIVEHTPVFDKVWTLCIKTYPEATTSVYELNIPCRWHLFWLQHITRKDTLPNEKIFHILSEYSGEYHKQKYMIKMFNHIVQKELYTKIKHGLTRLVSILNK